MSRVSTDLTLLRRRVDRVLGRRDEREQSLAIVQVEITQNDAYLAVAERVTPVLQSLSDRLFRKLLDVVEAKISVALQEVLDQPLELKAKVEFSHNATSVSFVIDREGKEEDPMLGQGGSVANVLSVGLRLLALATLPEKAHRGFLVLDEQDCWLRAELVPALVKIVARTGRELGFQVLMISHHEVEIFEKYADKVYRVAPMMGGVVQVREVGKRAAEEDRN